MAEKTPMYRVNIAGRWLAARYGIVRPDKSLLWHDSLGRPNVTPKGSWRIVRKGTAKS